MNNGTENGLRPATKWFYLSAVLLLAVALASVSLTRTRRVMEKTLEELTRARSGLARMQAATEERKQALAVLKSQLDRNVRQSSPEMVLYRKIDEFEARLKPDDLTMSAIEKKGGEASLQFTLFFNNPDFNALLNTVNSMHANTFPMTPVSAIAITQAEGKGAGGLVYKVSGKIITDDKVTP